ncbi:MAG: C2H2-type zinc finger protein [Planctomycetota bacterium]|nr:C2H2-type zinc finger protein [Planctomycetota bacterium]
MATFKCDKCGREFKNDRALKVHIGMAHGSKRKGKKKTQRASSRIGKFTCDICGRSFKMAMHLARHVKAAHGIKPRKVGRKTRGGVRGRGAVGAPAGVPKGLNVDALSIDELLAVKKAVDTRLSGIAQKMRQLKLG